MLFLLFSLVLICSAVESKDYTVIVKTSSEPFSGTDAQVKIRVFGTLSNIAEREIRGSFEAGSTDTIRIQDYDIGHVTGMEVRRNQDGIAPDWRLDKITIRIADHVDSIFNYDGWVSSGRWITLPLSCPSGFHVNQEGYCGE
ncbi:hypothetical protein ACROYT_G019528 [Oculina patagonica]